MTKFFAGLSVGFALLSVPLLAADEQNARDPSEVVCKQEKKVNSRFTTKTCHTRAEWEAIAEATKRAYAEQRDRPSIVPPGK